MCAKRLLTTWMIFAFALLPGVTRAETISGLVTVTPGGAPMQGVSIQATLVGSEQAVFLATSQSNGSYVLNLPPVQNLPSNNFRLRASAPDFYNLVYESVYCIGACAFALGSTVTVPIGTNIANINFAMRALTLATIQGTVTDAPSGALLSGVTVRATQYVDGFTDNTFQRSTTTNGSGQFSLEVVAGVPLRIGAFPSDGRMIEFFPEITCFPCQGTAGSELTLSPGQVLTDTNFTLSFPGSASGTVSSITNAGPIEGAVVEFVASDGYTGRSTTIANGSYAIVVPPGTYRASIVHASVHLRELWNDLPCGALACAPASGTPIIINASANTPGIDFALLLGNSISGRVNPPNSVLDAAGVLVFDTNGVLLDDTPGRNDSSPPFAYRTRVGFPSGNYFLRTFGGGGRVYVHKIYDNLPCDLDCNPIAGTPIAVTSGADTTDIDLDLGFGCAIFVTVREDVTQRLLPTARVQVFNSVGTLIRDSMIDPASASFNIDPLRSVDLGQYFVKALSPRHIDEVYDGLACETGCNVTLGTPLVCSDTSGSGSVVAPISLQRLELIFANGFD